MDEAWLEDKDSNRAVASSGRALVRQLANPQVTGTADLGDGSPE